jgi:hypothetical protein
MKKTGNNILSVSLPELHAPELRIMKEIFPSEALLRPSKMRLPFMVFLKSKGYKLQVSPKYMDFPNYYFKYVN